MNVLNQLSAIEFDRLHLWHPYSAPPSDKANTNLLVKDAADVYLTLDDGSVIIDAMSSWWCAIHGYNHPHINQAIEAQLSQVSHVMFGGITHEPAIKLGKKLVDLTPPSLNNIFYSDSGSVAVEVAMKMAVQYQYSRNKKDKHKFLSIRSGYYGDTWKAMSVSDPSTGMHHLFSGALQIEYFVSRPPITFNQTWDSDPQKNGLSELSELLRQHGSDIAAMILEPVVQGAGGMYFYHPEYLNGCRKLCDEHDVLVIFDEIATGFGRTGKLFATDHCDIQADIMSIGKALTGGYLSFAATLCSDKVTQAIEIGEPGAFMRVGNIELQLKEELKPALNFDNVKEVRAIGAIGVIEMNHAVSAHTARELCPELGVWLRPFANNIYCMPPYIINSDELSMVTAAMLELAKRL